MTTPDLAPDISVVLPIHNEVGHVHQEIDRIKEALESSPYSFEIIAIDDGSTDGSGNELRQRTDIHFIQLIRNQGAGFARKIGTRAARGRVVVWTDVDMTYPNDRIPQLVKELEGYDQVVGARRTEAGSARHLRIPAKWFIRRLAAYLLKTEIPDLNSGFRAFRRDVANQFLHVLPKGFSCVTTMTMSFLANGYSVKHVPIDYLPRAGESKFHWWRDTKRYVLQVIRMVLSYEPLRFFLPLALGLATVGIVKLTFDVIDKQFRVGTNTLLIFFAAFQLLVIGLLADLVVRVTKPREEVEPAREEANPILRGHGP
jgi:glycosyltransferase involved in cell wall biosynthesis